MTATAETSVRVDACGPDRRRDASARPTKITSSSCRCGRRPRSGRPAWRTRGCSTRLRGPEGWLFVVADGVGGRPGGALASETAVTALVEYIGQAAGCFNKLDVDREHEFLEQLELRCARAHRRISEQHGGGAGPERAAGPATTLTMAMLVWPRAYIVHVGDSRAFYLRKGRLRQLTRDQTTGEYMVDSGAWTEEQAQKAPIGGDAGERAGRTGDDAVGRDWWTCSRATRCCSAPTGSPGTCPTSGSPRCSAGATDAGTACRELVEAALAGGGHDNITVVVARMHAGPGV